MRFPDDGVGHALWGFRVEGTSNTVAPRLVDPSGRSPRVTSSDVRDVRVDGVPSGVEIVRSDDRRKLAGDEVEEASEPGGQDDVSVLPPTSLQPLGKGSQINCTRNSP